MGITNNNTQWNPTWGYGEGKVYEDYTLPRGVKETVFGGPLARV